MPLVPGGLLGVDAVLPRLFGFTEYSDLVELLEAAGFRRGGDVRSGPSLQRLHLRLAEGPGRVGASAGPCARRARGGLGVRARQRGRAQHGRAPGALLPPVRRRPSPAAPSPGRERAAIATLLLGAVPSGGGIPALEAILAGHRVGFSTTTLAAPVVARMPAIYQLLPPKGAPALLDASARPLGDDLHDVEVWDSHGWDPLRRTAGQRDAAGGPRGAAAPSSSPRSAARGPSTTRSRGRPRRRARPASRCSEATACRRSRARSCPSGPGRCRASSPGRARRPRR